MTSVSLELSAISQNGGYVEIDAMPPDLKEALHDSGVSDHELEQIAGEDRVIRGEAEWASLFARLDAAAEAPRSAGIGRDAGSRSSAVGRAFEALRAKVDENRARTAREGGLRFQGDLVLADVSAKTRTLGTGDAGEHVRRVQQALADVGLLDGARVNGRFDAATGRAVERFQREVGLPRTGTVDHATLAALAASAPPPGERLERSAEYDRLFADDRLSVTIALGTEGRDPDGERAVLSGLRAQGYHVVNTAEERTRLGLTGDRFDPNALYFARTVHDERTSKDVDVVVRLVSPSPSEASTKASLDRALRQDQVVLFAGGRDDRVAPSSGDDRASSSGDALTRRAERPAAGLRASFGNDRDDARTSGDRPDYQLVVLGGSTTEARADEVKGALGRGALTDLDVLSTTIPMRQASRADHVLRFLDGITRREPNDAMLKAQTAIEAATLRSFGLDRLAESTSGAYAERGFLGNGGNRRVAR